MWYIYLVEYYSATKKNRGLTRPTVQMKLETIMLTKANYKKEASHKKTQTT